MATKKQLLFRGLLFLLIFSFQSLFFPLFCFADLNSENPSLKTVNKALFQEWLKINLYKKNNKTYKSEIVNDDYFVSPVGRTNPLAEYYAFKKLILGFLEKRTSEKVLCRFPARMTLFEKYYVWFNEKERPVCADYNKENRPKLIVSVSLIHVSGYFDNPSSYYGHTLLRLNYRAEMPDQISLNSSISYGANITDSESSPLYVANGLFGGYEARYRRNNHFLHTHNYTNNQIRDVWEYELILTPQQIKFISEIIWELNNARFKYYFLNDNCAHRVAKILELAMEINITKSHGFWLLPMQVVRNLDKESKKQNPGFIKQETYHPSLKRVFFDRYKLLSKSEKRKFIKFFSASSLGHREITEKLSTKILLLIIDYLDIQVADGTSRIEDAELMSELQNKRSIVLSQLMKFDTKSIYKFKKNSYKYNSLLASQPASVIRVGYGVRSNSSFSSLSYRVANNDFFDSPDPNQEISKFVMGKLEAEINESSARITNATLIDIVHYNTNPLPFSITSEYSWSMNVGYFQRSRVCSNCSTYGVGAKWGISKRIHSRAMLYGMFGGRIHTKQGNDRGIMTIAPEVGSFINLTKNVVLGISATYHNDVVLDHSEYVFKANMGFNFSRNLDIRGLVESDGDMVTSMFNVGYYFD